eukprot:6188403-Pleurochrysis_carterae.AAC.2
MECKHPWRCSSAASVSCGTQRAQVSQLRERVRTHRSGEVRVVKRGDCEEAAGERAEQVRAREGREGASRVRDDEDHLTKENKYIALGRDQDTSTSRPAWLG